MIGRFDPALRLLPSGEVRVRGPFDPGSPDVESARVLFLIVQGDGDGDTVIVEGEGTWEKGATEWSADVSIEGKRAGGGKDKLRVKPEDTRVRGIALAIAIRPGEQIEGTNKFHPPSIELLNWCADSTLIS